MSHSGHTLPAPLDKIEIECPAGTRKDFGLAPDNPYPLKGVTYPVDYGYLPGYIGEDGVDLDFFVGSQPAGLSGFILVNRPEIAEPEHKFFVQLSENELEQVVTEFSPVLVEEKVFGDLDELLEQIKVFKS